MKNSTVPGQGQKPTTPGCTQIPWRRPAQFLQRHSAERRLDWRLALLVLFFAPMPALIAMRAAPEQVSRERTLLDQWARIYSRFNEVLSGILIVRSFTMEEMEKQHFLKDVEAANRTVVRGVAVDTGYGSASNLVIAIARVAAIALGVYLITRNEITVGTLIAFLGYVGGLFGPVQGLSGIYQTLSKASVSLEEIFKILSIQEYLGDSPDARDIGTVRGDVIFRNVHFHYEQSGRPLLNGIDLDVKAGQTLAIVGPSGSGKTTLMALLMRFYDPQQGAMLLDGHDLRTLKQSAIRRNIGVVLQTTVTHADRIIVLKDGRIIESGRHEELMARSGYYASLVHRQQRGLIPNDATAEPALTPALAL